MHSTYDKKSLLAANPKSHLQNTLSRQPPPQAGEQRLDWFLLVWGECTLPSSWDLFFYIHLYIGHRNCGCCCCLKTSNGFSQRWKCGQHSQDFERWTTGLAVAASWVCTPSSAWHQGLYDMKSPGTFRPTRTSSFALLVLPLVLFSLHLLLPWPLSQTPLAWPSQ